MSESKLKLISGRISRRLFSRFLVLTCFRAGDDESEAAGVHYAEQTQLIAKKAKLALVNRQIEELKKAKKTISTDYASADAQLAMAEV